MKKARENQMIYLFVGVFSTGVGIYINYDDILHLRFPDGMMSLFLGISSLMMAYLSPHLFPRDERTSEIIGKSMSVNYFVLFGTILILFLVTGSLGPLSLTATQVLIVLFCVMITSIPATMIVYSKRI
ncbi:hypothetical protein [Rummeliibacillus suwonensis]|uniref:hypothetical protein n=1 Tax=Rummeliibacillus suwonensis TaxID=1306154 RepID=UPI002898A889|nr:hypothetical protein [Rummeliibacillus suwonensis]